MRAKLLFFVYTGPAKGGRYGYKVFLIVIDAGGTVTIN